jgi:copper chaperone
MPTTKTYKVSGMTCGHCVAAVTDEVSRIDGVSRVSIHLVAGAGSSVTVTSERPLPWEIIRTAVDEAGYDLTGVSS